MDKLDNLIAKILYYICALLMLVMAVVITSQVISRYVFGSPFTWSEELGRYTFVWLSFLGMAIAVKQGSHIALDILVNKLTGVKRRTLMVINNLFVMVFSLVLTYGGYNLVAVGARQSSPSLNLPMDLVYSVIPVSGILLFYFALRETMKVLQRKEEGI
ncbi:TRAP transporter small permease [Peptococcaceae bacterium 1198_IL3148]